MNMSRQQLPRGNKLLLPKIEYARMVEAEPVNGQKPNTSSGTEKNNGELEVAEKVPLLNNDNNTGSFTRFSVLPPINDSVRNARRLSRFRRISGAFVSANGPSPTSNHELANRKGDNNKLHKYAGFSSVAVQQRRASAVDHERVQSLQVVGKPYSREEYDITTTLSIHGKLNAKSPRRSFSSPMPTDTSDSNCSACTTLLARRRSKTEGAMDSGNPESVQTYQVAHTCIKNKVYTGHILKRFNSEELYLRNDNIVSEQNKTVFPSSRRGKKSPKLISKPEITINLKTANLAVSDGRRPVSRCEISLDVNEATQQLQLVTDREKKQAYSQKRNFKPPLIQIDNMDEEAPGKQNEETPSAPGIPQIQILIDSLESAKEERPKEGREVPYTSVREQRRRSALCRTNSKQVDDFLLVHNLRDLGLL